MRAGLQRKHYYCSFLSIYLLSIWLSPATLSGRIQTDSNTVFLVAWMLQRNCLVIFLFLLTSSVTQWVCVVGPGWYAPLNIIPPKRNDSSESANEKLGGKPNPLPSSPTFRYLFTYDSVILLWTMNDNSLNDVTQIHISAKKRIS